VLTHVAAAAAVAVSPLQEKGVQLLLPTDVVIADKFDPNANTQTVSADKIPDGWMVRQRPAAAACLCLKCSNLGLISSPEHWQSTGSVGQADKLF
jgi:hypothetical protein